MWAQGLPERRGGPALVPDPSLRTPGQLLRQRAGEISWTRLESRGLGGGEWGWGLTWLQELLLGLSQGPGSKSGVPSLLQGQLLGQEVNLIFQSGLGLALS